MKNKFKFVFNRTPLVCLAFLAILAAGCGGEKASSKPTAYAMFDPEQPGPFKAGYARSQSQAINKKFNRKLPLDIWYPVSGAATGKTVKYLGFIAGDALENAQILEPSRPYPMVIFSHGNQSVSVQNSFECEQLASHGYVVVAPTHVKNSMTDYDASMVREMLVIRPADISAVIDWAGESEYAKFINFDAIGISGHSYGGYTSIAVTGPELHPDIFNQFCALPSSAGNWGCDFFGQLDVNIQPKINYEPRIKAAVALSPAFYHFWGKEGLSKARAPIMIMNGTDDTTTPYDINALHIYADLPPPRALMTVSGANHFSFTIMCDILGPGVDQCGPSAADVNTVKKIVNIYSTVFFGIYLKKIPAYQEYLDRGSSIPILKIDHAE